MSISPATANQPLELQPGAKKTSWLFLAGLLLVLLVALCFRLGLFVGTTGSDDVVAMIQAKLIANDPHTFVHEYFPDRGRGGGSPVRFRLGMLLPGAAVIAAGLPAYPWLLAVPMLASLAGVVLVYCVAWRLYGAVAALLAALLMAVAPLDVVYASIFLPDVLMALLQGLVLVFLMLARRASGVRAGLWSAAAGVAAYGAWTTKEVGAGIMFVAFLFAVHEMLCRRPFLRYIWTAVAFGTGLLADCGFYYYASGDPLLRWHCRAANQEFIAFYADARGRATTFAQKLHVWVEALSKDASALGFLLPAALLVSPFSLWRANARRLFAGCFLLMLALFLLSLIPTYSYQPRRLMTMALPAALLLASYVPALLRGRPRQLLLLALAGFGICVSARATISLGHTVQAQTASSKRAREFLRAHDDALPVFADSRTQRELCILEGIKFDTRIVPLAMTKGRPSGKVSQEVHLGTYNLFRNYGLVGPEQDDKYRREILPLKSGEAERGYVLLNWRYINWMLKDGLTAYEPAVMCPPMNWRLLESIEEADWPYPLQIFAIQPKDQPAWCRVPEADVLNLGLRRSAGSLLPDGWAMSGNGFTPYDVLKPGPDGQPVICLQSNGAGQQQLFTGGHGFSVPPGPLGDAATPVLQPDRWYRLDMDVRTAAGSTVQIVMFTYDRHDRQHRVDIERVANQKETVRRSFFFRSLPEPARFRLGFLLSDRGPVWLSNLGLAVQDELASTRGASN
jgi:4-amino-4-deoxy-L-arabinose transferase-like glycosyltransferase